MKTIVLTLPIFLFCCESCQQHGISKRQAFDILKKDLKYPKDLGYNIYLNDPEETQKLKNSLLETEGFIQISPSKTVNFTQKAEPYKLSPQGTKFTTPNQRVKTGEDDLEGVQGIILQNDNKVALVDYTTKHVRLTPFGQWLGIDSNKPAHHRAMLSLYDDGWRVQGEPQ